MIEIAQAPEHLAIGILGALHRLDDAGLAPFFRAVYVITLNIAEAGAPGEADLAALEHRRERRAAFAPLGVAPCFLPRRRLGHSFGPKIAGNQLEILIELLADIAVDAMNDFRRAARGELAHPVGIGEKLARHADEIGLALGEKPLGIEGGADLADRDNGDGVTAFIERALDGTHLVSMGERRIPLAWHAAIAGIAGIGIKR